MDKACSMHERLKMNTKFWSKNHNGKKTLRTSVDGRIILEWITGK